MAVSGRFRPKATNADWEKSCVLSEFTRNQTKSDEIGIRRIYPAVKSQIGARPGLLPTYMVSRVPFLLPLGSSRIVAIAESIVLISYTLANQPLLWGLWLISYTLARISLYYGVYGEWGIVSVAPGS